jgi:hypothetical protein
MAAGNAGQKKAPRRALWNDTFRYREEEAFQTAAWVVSSVESTIPGPNSKNSEDLEGDDRDERNTAQPKDDAFHGVSKESVELNCEQVR